MEAELYRADLIARVGAEKAARLEPRYPQGSPIVVDPGVTWSGDALGVIEQLQCVREQIGLGPAPAGSNNWVVSGDRSVTGKPLLAGDPHITATIPTVWYRVELQAPEIDLSGGCMPGFPGVFIGQSRHVAWTFTNVMADVQDLFVERIREGQNGDGPQYQFQRRVAAGRSPHRVDRRARPVRARGGRGARDPPRPDRQRRARRQDERRSRWRSPGPRCREPFFTRMALDVGYVRQRPRGGRQLR